MRLGLWLAAGLIGLAGLTQTLSAAPTVGKDIVVNIDPQPNGLGNDHTHHGYLEYRVRLTNTSKTREHRVTLALPNSSFGGDGDTIEKLTRSVVVAPETTAVVSLLQPPVPITGGGLLVRTKDNRKTITLNPIDHPARTSWNTGQKALVLTSKSVDANLADRALRHARQSYLQVVRADVGIADFSVNWLGYTCYDGLVVTDGDMRRMPAGVKQAVRRYVECGGSLTVLGRWRIDDSWHAEPYAWKANVPRQGEHYFVGFGEVRVIPQQAANQITDMDYQLMVDDWRRTASPWREAYEINGANNRFPVVEERGVPVRGLMLLIIAFAVLIGPVNLWLLGRKRKRMWLLWTVPAISLLFSGAVWVYASFSEGWGARERTEGITLLDERKLTATTLGVTAYYSTLTPGDGLRFDADTELTPALTRESHYGDGRSRTLDTTDGQHLRSGWIVARVPAHFKVRKSDPTQRARINPTIKPDGTPEAVNGLGAGVTRLALATPDGRIFTAGPTPAGQRFVFTPSGQQAQAPPITLRRLYQNTSSAVTMKELAINPNKYLRPGTYIAVMDENPFIESGLGKAHARESRAIVYGIADMQPKQ